MKKIALLGSTGSIGTQTLAIIQEHADEFKAEVLTAFNNSSLLIEQAKTFLPSCVVIVNENKYSEVKDALSAYQIKVLTGEKALLEVVKESKIDIVLTALVGAAGLLPTIEAIKASKKIALANKETLVIAGELIQKLLKEYPKSTIIPVDSEHSAIFQCLTGELAEDINKVYITASGGPFRGKDKAFLSKVTKEQALNHPNWKMGDKITIDSATMMNKGLEVIEAKWLFNLSASQIKVVVHPQSIIHSMVEFKDGSIKAQIGIPDMKVSIRYALTFPKRLKSKDKKLSFDEYSSLTFEPPNKIFKNLDLAYEAMNKGGNSVAALNAANEEAVDAFLKEKISFLRIAEINQQVFEKNTCISNPTLEQLITTDIESRKLAKSLIKVL